MNKIRITSRGSFNDTIIEDVETHERLECVLSVEIHITSYDLPIAILKVPITELDIITEATMEKVPLSNWNRPYIIDDRG